MTIVPRAVAAALISAASFAALPVLAQTLHIPIPAGAGDDGTRAIVAIDQGAIQSGIDGAMGAASAAQVGAAGAAAQAAIAQYLADYSYEYARADNISGCAFSSGGGFAALAFCTAAADAQWPRR